MTMQIFPLLAVFSRNSRAIARNASVKRSALLQFALLILCFAVGAKSTVAAGQVDVSKLMKMGPEANSQSAVSVSKQKFVEQRAKLDTTVFESPVDALLKKGGKAATAKERRIAYLQALALLDRTHSRNQKAYEEAFFYLTCCALGENNENTYSEDAELCARAISWSEAQRVTSGSAAEAQAAFVKGLAYLKLAELAVCTHSPESETFCQESMTLLKKAGASNSYFMGSAYLVRADILSDRIKYDEAEPFAQRALVIFKNLGNHNWISRALVRLAMIQEHQNRWMQEEVTLLECVPEAEQAYGPNALAVAHAWELMGLCQKAQGRDKEARASFAKALDIRRLHPQEEQLFTFMDGAPNCDRHYKDGVLFERIEGNGITAEIGFVSSDDCYRVDLHIVNDSPAPIDVLPEKARLSVWQPNESEQKQVQVERFRNRVMVANTVAPGSDTAGIVCFESKGTARQWSFEVVIGYSTFSFQSFP